MRLSDGAKVAVKKVRYLDQEYEQLARREFSILSQLKGTPNIVEAFDFYSIKDHSLLFMSFLAGQTITQLVESTGQGLSEQFSLKVAQKLVAALKGISAKKIIHRDFNPQNVLLTTRADGELEPFIIDFNVARQHESGLIN